MGCGGCGGVGHDPYAAHRHGNNRGVRRGKGSTAGVTKSEKRLAREQNKALAQKQAKEGQAS